MKCINTKQLNADTFLEVVPCICRLYCLFSKIPIVFIFRTKLSPNIFHVANEYCLRIVSNTTHLRSMLRGWRQYFRNVGNTAQIYAIFHKQDQHEPPQKIEVISKIKHALATSCGHVQHSGCFISHFGTYISGANECTALKLLCLIIKRCRLENHHANR